MTHTQTKLLYLFASIGLVLVLAGVLLLVGSHSAAAQDNPRTNPTFHPTFPLLDASGENVLKSGAPVSTMKTCGSCHDTAFIASDSLHANAGSSTLSNTWSVIGGRNWDTPQTSTVEMNCFLCHAAAPNNAARISTLEAGNFEWANSATLQGTGIIDMVDDNWRWNTPAFNTDGTVREDLILIQDPTDANCGQCHGVVHSDAQTPLTLPVLDATQWSTLTTGQVFSPQRLLNTGMNLQDKETLDRSWDVHAERVVGCTDCHYALNNPVFDTEVAVTRPDHLQFDPRRMDFGEYLYRPLHQFANTDVETISQFGGAHRSCDSCHNAVSTHTWLPYAERHTSAVSCETCHVPKLYAPALESVDWTVLQTDGKPVMSYRGVAYEENSPILTGFQPTLLPTDSDGKTRLAPYNLVSAWYWVSGDPATPVPVDKLQTAWLADGAYAADILAAFDADANGTLEAAELKLDSEAKVKLVADKLKAQGLENPRIVGEVHPYAIHHNVTNGTWATRECSTCHTDDSRLNTPVMLSGYTPGGVEPTFTSSDAHLNGTLTRGDNGTLFYQPAINIAPTNLYVLGHDSVWWIDLLGVLIFLGTFAGVILHGGLRYLSARRAAAHAPAEVKPVYMYSVYEREWHWLQTVVIFGMLFTGLIIHKPDTFGMFSFQGVVLVHNALAIVLVINAALAAFYHLASGEIRQFLPRPYGFFDQAFAQAKYYMQGIFRGDPHPFEKERNRKMNPLQQVTYMMILNVLLPLQVITGALMWGAQHFPAVTAQLGGLAFLAPLHTLVAWLFASFVVMHVYLTTTGHTPLANIKAMMTGWDEVETHSHESHGSEPQTGEGVAS